MEKEFLGSLPDELVLDIVEYLDTTKDVAHLATSTRRAHNIIERDGWKTFIKTRFPSLTIPSNDQTSWSAIADKLTHLDRCWEKRGFWLNVFHERKEQHGRFQRRPMGSQSVSFHAVLDSCLSPSLDNEILATGAGENLLVRLKPQSGDRSHTWYTLEGKSHGYSAGTGDVTAVSIIEREGCPEVVVGRANGDVQVVSTMDSFENVQQNLTPVDEVESNRGSDPMRKSPGQLAVSWTEWQPQSHLLASCKGPVLTLHDLTDRDQKDLSPVAHYDFSNGRENDEACLLRSVKFLNKDTIACALGGSREPLRWGKVTPTGVEFINARNIKSADEAATLHEARSGEKTTVRAIEPVRGTGSENMILSAWDDGTYRLFDIRTPSSHDAVYRDQFQPYEAASSLLVYGTERFIAGSNIAPDIRLFDFRYPKPYHHSSGFPCSSRSPIPGARTSGPRWDDNVWELDGFQSYECNPRCGRMCPYHGLSKQDGFRPDATIHIGNPAYDRIYCLSKASDMSSSVYCGLRGAFLEMNLVLTEKEFIGGKGPDQVLEPVPSGWRMGRPGGKISLIETGVSLCQSEDWSVESRAVPTLIAQRPGPPSRLKPMYPLECHRLDSAFLLLEEEPAQRSMNWQRRR
ncbi:Fc.00g039780.m01.CDS01 [Cosmosporella sp. VM-42]